MRSASLPLVLILALFLAASSLSAEAPLLSGFSAECAPSTPASLLPSNPVPMSHLPCCLDEWQSGGICNPGQRLASYCSSPGCENCGTFFCYSGTCLQ